MIVSEETNELGRILTGAAMLVRTGRRDNLRRNLCRYLLLIFMPPRGGFKGCLVPSAKDVVLGRPLILPKH